MNLTSSPALNSLITAKWVDQDKDHRILLGNTTSRISSLKAFLPKECPRSQEAKCTLVAVQLEGKETELLINTTSLCRLLGIKPFSVMDKNPTTLGQLLTGKKSFLNALDQAAKILEAKPALSTRERQTILSRTAQKISAVSTKKLEKASLLPYNGVKEIQFWQKERSRELGRGSFGAAHTVKMLGGRESSDLVLKLAHSLNFFRQEYTEEKACKKRFSAETDLINEFNLLKELHGEKILEGIQLPPHQIVPLGTDDDRQVGYLGARYDSSLYHDKNTYATPESTLQLLRGLSFLSDKISHRDIKPENILVKKGPPSRVDIADFGGALTKETLKRIWDKGIQKIEALKKNKPEEESLFQRLLWGSSQNEAIHQAEKDLCSNLGQAYTPDFVPDEARDDEFAAIQAGDFESFFAIRQRGDLFALGESLNELFEGYEDRLSSQQLEIIEKMRDYENHPLYTVEEALQEWQLPETKRLLETKSLVQTLITFFTR